MSRGRSRPAKTRLLVPPAAAVLIYLCYLAVALGIQRAPVFTWSLLGLFLFILGWINTERTGVHSSNEWVTFIWSFIGACFGFCLLFTVDSPLYWVSRLSRNLAWLLIVLVFYLSLTYCRYEFSKTLKNNSFGIRNVAVSPKTDNLFKERIESIQNSYNFLSRPWFDSTSMNLFYLVFGRSLSGDVNPIYKEEKNIVDKIKSCHNINLLFQEISLPAILYRVKDHNLFNENQMYRTELVRFLNRDEACLDIATKASLISALQLLPKRYHKHIPPIFEKMFDLELTRLKLSIDSKMTVETIHKLLFRSSLDFVNRQKVLDHFELNKSFCTGKNNTRGLKIVSDIDDTMTCSGGFPGGCDDRYPKHQIYPGVLAFYRELDRHNNRSIHIQCNNGEELAGNLVFLSARPHIYKDILSESISLGKLEKLYKMKRGGIHCKPSILPGEFTSSFFMTVKEIINMMIPGIKLNSMEDVAQTKFKSYSEYTLIYPECDFIIVGDNGQGDARLAELALDHSSFNARDSKSAAYLHIVKPLEETVINSDYFSEGNQSPDKLIKKIDEEGRASICNGKIIFFKTYVDAAIDAFERNLIDKPGLVRILDESKENLKDIENNGYKETIESEHYRGFQEAALKKYI